MKPNKVASYPQALQCIKHAASLTNTRHKLPLYKKAQLHPIYQALENMSFGRTFLVLLKRLVEEETKPSYDNPKNLEKTYIIIKTDRTRVTDMVIGDMSIEKTGKKQQNRAKSANKKDNRCPTLLYNR